MQQSRAEQRSPRVRLTLDHVYVIAALMLLALRPLLTPIPQNDFWWHMATGRAILSQGSIPTVDTFSFTRAGVAFFNQGWLAQCFMFGLYQIGKLPLVILVQVAVIVLAYGLLLRLCILRTGRLRLAVALLLLTTMPLSFDNWTVRPQTYAFPIFAGFLTILDDYRYGRADRLWLLVPLMALWANIHGSFVLGIAMLALVGVGGLIEAFQPVRPDQHDSAGGPSGRRSVLNPRFILWALLAMLMVLVNPRGPGVLAYVRDLLSSNQVTTLVTEWAAPTIRDISGLIFFLFLITCFLALAYSPRKPRATDLLLFLAFLYLALGAVRNIVWFGFIATPLLVDMLAARWPTGRTKTSAGTPALNAALVGLLSVLLLIGSPWLKPELLPPSVGALLNKETPVAAVEYMQAQPDRPMHLFHAMDYGSYLIWVAPEQKVFIDPRIELYPFAQWRDYLNLSDGSDMTELLSRYQIDGALLSVESQKPLIDALVKDPAWQLRYRDEQTVYFTQKRS